MLKIGKYIRISVLTPLLFFLCCLIGKLEIISVSYGVMLLHELCHTVAALCIGLKVDKIILQPFGVNLRLANRFVHSLSDEMILYMSGPLFNIVLALVSLFAYSISKHYLCQYLYFMNIALFVLNMLPIMPLDGGVILKKILGYYLGTKTATTVMKIVSGTMLCGVVIVCVWSVAVSRINVSVLIIALFLLGSVLQGEEKYDIDFVKSLMFAKQKEKRKIKHILAKKDADILDIAANFSNNRYCVVYLTEENGRIFDTITEREIIDRLT